jgi:phosphoribosylformylglycinamidine (FGAM) synthase-like enzyme
VDDFRRCVTSDAKLRGNSLYLLGRTRPGMGGSLFYYRYGGRSALVPDTDPAASKAAVDGLVAAIRAGLLASCHDVSDGGLATAVTEMCLGGNMGAEVDQRELGSMPPQVKLFSESPARWLLEVPDKSRARLEGRLRRFGLVKLGGLSGDAIRISSGRRKLVELAVKDAREAWQSPLWSAMG